MARLRFLNSHWVLPVMGSVEEIEAALREEFFGPDCPVIVPTDEGDQVVNVVRDQVSEVMPDEDAA